MQSVKPLLIVPNVGNKQKGVIIPKIIPNVGKKSDVKADPILPKVINNIADVSLPVNNANINQLNEEPTKHKIALISEQIEIPIQLNIVGTKPPYDNSIECFINRECNVGEGFSETAANLFRNYITACGANKIEPLFKGEKNKNGVLITSQTFTKAFTTLGYRTRRSNGKTFIIGLRNKLNSNEVQKSAQYEGFEVQMMKLWDSSYYNGLTRECVISEADKLCSINEMLGENSERYCLAIKAACGLGKSSETEKYIRQMISGNSNFSCLFVTHRRTLVSKQRKDVGDLKFESYLTYSKQTEIKNVPRLICQIDSLHKVTGKYDLMILDEFKSIKHQLVQFTKEKASVVNALIERVSKTDKVIAIDALLSDGDIEFFEKCGREVNIHWNTTQKHFDKKIILVDNKAYLSNIVINKVKEGKKVIIPTGSSKYALAFEEMLLGLNPNLNVKTYTAKYHDGSDPVEEWPRYDVVIYSPCVAAGNSYVGDHFDTTVGYFPAVSCGPEIALQMLFRCRQNKDNEIYLCIETQGSTPILDANNLAEVKDKLLLKDRIAHADMALCNAIHTVKMSRITSEIDENDPYFSIYSDVINDINTGRKHYIKKLLEYLKLMGVLKENFSAHSVLSVKDQEEVTAISNVKKSFTKIKAETIRREVEAICNAPNIDYLTKIALSKKEDKTPEERNALRKAKLKEQYRVENLTPKFVEVVATKFKIKRRLQALHKVSISSSENVMDELGQSMQNLVYGPGADIDTVLDSYENTVQRLSYSDKLIEAKQCAHTFNFLLNLGFNNDVLGNSEYLAEPNYESLYKYISNNHDDLGIIFNSSPKNTPDECFKWASEKIFSTYGIKLTKCKSEGLNKPLKVTRSFIYQNAGDETIVFPVGFEDLHDKIIHTEYRKSEVLEGDNLPTFAGLSNPKPKLSLSLNQPLSPKYEMHNFMIKGAV